VGVMREWLGDKEGNVYIYPDKFKQFWERYGNYIKLRKYLIKEGVLLVDEAGQNKVQRLYERERKAMVHMKYK
jgi:hypothetical protein